MKPDLEAIRARLLKQDLSASEFESIMQTLACIEEQGSPTTYTIGETEWAHRIAVAEQRFVDEYDLRKAAERERDALREEMFAWQHVIEYMLGKDWMHEGHGPKEARAELAQRAKKRADEYGALLQERDEERMRTRCFEQALAEAQDDSVDYLFRRLKGTVCAFKVNDELVMVPGEEVARTLARFLCLIEIA